jgi:putative nucleotidyltransferase with HDIG domain
MKLGHISIDQLMEGISSLPPMPQVVHKALELMHNPGSGMDEVASILALDQVMASRVLRLANSAYYALPFPIPTVNQAVVYLGQNTILSLVLTFSLESYLNRPLPGYGMEKGQLWRRAIGVAVGAKLVAEPYGREFAEEAYNAGLLCDIGKLAIETYLRNMKIPADHWTGHSFSEVEKAVTGFDHATVGAEMARRWRLPPAFVAGIAYHHKPSLADKYSLLASTIHIADATMMMMGVGVGIDGLQYELDTTAFDRLGWNGDRLLTLFDQIQTQVEKAENSIGMSSSN